MSRGRITIGVGSSRRLRSGGCGGRRREEGREWGGDRARREGRLREVKKNLGGGQGKSGRGGDKEGSGRGGGGWGGVGREEGDGEGGIGG